MALRRARIRELARDRVLKLMKIPVRYNVGGVELELPNGHRLPDYQQAHRRYDRFLPVLTRQLAANDTVVDVGANVGDTIASLLEGQPALQVVAVEADRDFYQYLERNVRSIRERYTHGDVSLVRALVGASNVPMSLTGADGSKHAVPGTGTDAMAPRTLDAIFAELPARYAERFRLLKSDVDGFDFDVINSASAIVSSAQPLIYFECQPSDRHGRDQYVEMIGRLLRSGYQHMYLFDNFGNPLLHTSDPEIVSQCIDNIIDQERGTRTMYYLDVLMSTERDRKVAQAAIDQYRLI